MFKKVRTAIAVLSIVVLCSYVSEAEESRMSSFLTASSRYDSRYEDDAQQYVEEENAEEAIEVEGEYEIVEGEDEVISEEEGIEYEEEPSEEPDSGQYEYDEEPMEQGNIQYEEDEGVELDLTEEDIAEGEYEEAEIVSEEYEIESEYAQEEEQR